MSRADVAAVLDVLVRDPRAVGRVLPLDSGERTVAEALHWLP